MIFSLLINASEQWRACLDESLIMARTMLDTNHQINAVLFYGQAIQLLNCTKTLNQWQQFQQQCNADFMLCSTLLTQNQLTLKAEQTSYFTIISLGSWVTACENSDRILELR